MFSGKKNNELKIQTTVKIGTKKDIYEVYFKVHIKFTEVKRYVLACMMCTKYTC